MFLRGYVDRCITLQFSRPQGRLELRVRWLVEKWDQA